MWLSSISTPEVQRLSYTPALKPRNVAVSEACSFIQVMGSIKRIPIIKQSLVELAFPAALVLMILLTITKAEKKILNYFGLRDSYVPGQLKTQEMIKDGRGLIYIYRDEKLKQNVSITDYQNISLLNPTTDSNLDSASNDDQTFKSCLSQEDNSDFHRWWKDEDRR